MAEEEKRANPLQGQEHQSIDPSVPPTLPSKSFEFPVRFFSAKRHLFWTVRLSCYNNMDISYVSLMIHLVSTVNM